MPGLKDTSRGSDPSTVRAREKRRRKKASEKAKREALQGTSNTNLRRLLIEFMDEEERQAAGR